MILFKCDVCGVDCHEKVISCQLIFGKKDIHTAELKKTANMHRVDLCEDCFSRVRKNMGYTDEDIENVKEVL